MFSEHFEIDQLRSIVSQERKYKDTLENYCDELDIAISELEEQRQNSDEQNSEWKTRYEIQQEMNEQLRKQAATLQVKVATAASKSQSYKKSSKANAPPGEFGDDASSGLLSALEAEKRALMNQLFDIELRIEQEAKAYHKANEERKAVQQNASSVSAQLNALRLSVQPADAANFSADLVNRESAHQGKRHGISLKNIPPDQRVIDPKRGPIKRTAAVKQLPPLT